MARKLTHPILTTEIIYLYKQTPTDAIYMACNTSYRSELIHPIGTAEISRVDEMCWSKVLAEPLAEFSTQPRVRQQ
jgi:hypothetical protein